MKTDHRGDAVPSLSTTKPRCADFIDAFYGDIEQSLGEEDTSSNTGTAGSDVGVSPEVCSLVVQGENKSKTSASTIADGETTMPITPTTTAASTPLGLRTPPSKRVRITKIRAVEPVKRSLSQIDSAQILGYRDFPQDQALQRRIQASMPALDPSIQQKEDSMNKRKSNRVLFVLAVIAIICFAMICAVIILVVLNHLSRDDTTPPKDTSSPSNGRLFLGPNINSETIIHDTGPTPAPTPASVTIQDPILASILQNPSSDACPTAGISHTPLPGKKGVALTLRAEGEPGSWVENIPKLKKLNPYWNYSYEAKRIIQQPKNIEFIPMIWGSINRQWLQYTIDTDVLPQIRSGEAKRLLGFHEPDKTEEADMSVLEAILAWKVLQTVGLPMISPSSTDPSGSWISSFMAEVESECLRSEWLAVHWFDIPSFDLFRDTMVQYYLQYERPLFLAEFAPIDHNATSVKENRWSNDDVLSFMKEALPWLEATPWIQGYSWYSFDAMDPVGGPSALFDLQGNLTDCGRYYASVRSDGPNGDLRIGTSGDDADDVEQDVEQYNIVSRCEKTWKNSSPLALPGKKGLAMSQVSETAVVWLRDIADMTRMNVSWTFDFHSQRFYHDLDVPMFLPSIADDERLTYLLPKANESVSGNRILGFDRPDSEEESKFISGDLALDLWHSLESTNVPLVSPSCNDPLGEWMRNFMTAVDSNCRRVDWIGVRWQGSANFHHLKEYMSLIHETYQRPLMVTHLTLDPNEFHSAAEALTFMKQAVPWLEQNSYVDGYSWFPEQNTSTALLHGNGSLTALGEFYASVSAATPNGNQLIQPDAF